VERDQETTSQVVNESEHRTSCGKEKNNLRKLRKMKRKGTERDGSYPRPKTLSAPFGHDGMQICMSQRLDEREKEVLRNSR